MSDMHKRMSESAANHRQNVNQDECSMNIYCKGPTDCVYVVDGHRTQSMLICLRNSYSSINPSKIAFRRIEIRNYDKNIMKPDKTHGFVQRRRRRKKSKRNFWCELFNFSHRLHSICMCRDRWRRRRLT